MSKEVKDQSDDLNVLGKIPNVVFGSPKKKKKSKRNRAQKLIDLVDKGDKK